MKSLKSALKNLNSPIGGNNTKSRDNVLVFNKKQSLNRDLKDIADPKSHAHLPGIPGKIDMTSTSNEQDKNQKNFAFQIDSIRIEGDESGLT